jgi:hypothetical protein
VDQEEVEFERRGKERQKAKRDIDGDSCKRMREEREIELGPA